MKLKITPGPWAIERTTRTNYIGPAGDNGVWKLASVVAAIERRKNAGRDDANAEAIAAIPDILPALYGSILALRCEFSKPNGQPRPCSHVLAPCDCEPCRQYIVGLKALKKAGCE